MFGTFYMLSPTTIDELDDYFVEWKADNTWDGGGKQPSKTTYEKALAAVETCVPLAKHGMVQSRETLRSWRVCTTVDHTKAMSRQWLDMASGLGPSEARV